MSEAGIVVKGAREHNLKEVSLALPRNKLICFTGVSGSGKSSFAFDTLYAEGQRRYLESLSSYARQFIGQLAKPDVDQITGLSPAISIQQKTSGWNPRSTVGTVTQIHDYLRVIYAHVGRQHCPECSQPIEAQTREQIVSRILTLPAGAALLILGPKVRSQKGEFRDLFSDMIRQGFARARIDGVVFNLAEAPSLEKNKRHDIEIVVDRLTITPTVRPRLAEAVETALKIGDGLLIIQVAEDTGRGKPKSPETDSIAESKSRDILFSSQYACPRCNLSFEPPSPQLFSFNSPTGMCHRCDGLGTTFDFDPELLVPDPTKSFLKLAIEPMKNRIGRWRRHIYEAVARHVGFDLKTPWKDLPTKARETLLFGLGKQHLTFEWRWSGGVWRHGGTFDGVIAELREKHRKAKSSWIRGYYEKYMRSATCTVCNGARLNRQALAVQLGGRAIDDISKQSIRDAAEFFANLSLTPTEQIIAKDAIKEIRGRLKFLCDVGLEYLALDRTAPTLSGGESQRIRLASQIGAGLVDVLYILDEPSIGLHPRDNLKLLDSLRRLRDQGNTVIVVEHDEETMLAADYLVDFGPGPGVRGGEVVAHGDLDDMMANDRSITGQFLSRKKSIEVPKQRRPVEKRAVQSRIKKKSKAEA